MSFIALAAINSPSWAASGIHYNDGGQHHVAESTDVTTVDDNDHGLFAFNQTVISADDYLTVKTEGDYAYGANAFTDATITIGKSADIATHGETSHGVAAYVGGTVGLGDSGVITTHGHWAYGVYAWDASSAYIGDGVTITTNGHGAYGLLASYFDGRRSQIIAGDDLTITTNYTGGNPFDPYDPYDYASGIQAYGSSVEIGDRLTVTTYGMSSRGVESWEGGSVEIGEDATLTTYGIYSNGFDVRDSSFGYIGAGGTIETSGYNANGMIVLRGGAVSADDDLTITTYYTSGNPWDAGDAFDYSNGIWAEGVETKVEIGDRLTLTTYGARSRGIGVWDEAVVDIGDGGTIETYGHHAIGLWVFAHGGTASFIAGDGLTIYTYYDQANQGDPFDPGNPYDYAYGIWAEEGAGVTIGDKLSVTTKGSNSHAVTAYASYAEVSIDIGENAKIYTSGDNSYGLYSAWDGALISVDNGLDIATSGEHSYGARATWEGQIDFGDEIRVSTSGDLAMGVVADGTGTLNIGNKAAISTSGENADALLSSQGYVYAGDRLTITTSGYSSYGILAEGSGLVEIGSSANISTSNTSGIGVASLTSAWVLFDSGLKVKTKGDYAYGIFAREHGTVEIDPGSEITTGGAEAHAVYALNGGDIVIDGGTIIARDASSNAIFAESTYYFNNDSYIHGTGLFSIYGDIVAQADDSDGAVVDFTMEDGSVFTGAAMRQGDNTAAAEITLALQGIKTRWNVTGDSWLTTLSMDGSTVDFGATDDFITLTTGELDSNSEGTFKMKTEMSSLTGDKLVIANDSSGSFTISVADYGSGASNQNDTLTLVEDADGGAVFELAGGYANLGLWQYGLESVSAGSGFDWHLSSRGIASDYASAAVNTFRGAWLMGYAETQTLLQRMGDLRSSPRLSGVWFRVHGGKLETDPGRYAQAFDMDYGGVQIGFDRKFDKWSGNLYLGAMFGYADGDLDFTHAGDGSINSRTLGVYGTYVKPDGFYLDAVLKYQWSDNKFHTVEALGNVISAPAASMGGFGMSLEAGKRFAVGEVKNGGGWYVEPQAQISYQYYDGGSFTTNTGFAISVDDFKSLTGKLGARIGYETEKANFYAKASVVKEFDGDMTIRSGTASIEESFGNDWFVYGVGATSRINERNSLYLDVERTSGGNFEQPWRVIAGWRMEF